MNGPRVRSRRTVAVVGEFDGGHVGQRSLVREAATIAEGLALPLAAVVLERDRAPSLTPVGRRCELLLRAGATMAVARTVPMGHDSAMRGITDELVSTLGVEVAVLARPPGPEHLLRWPQLRSQLAAAGVEVIQVPREQDRSGRPVTSALVADHLIAGRVVEISRLLGRPYEISGIVDLGAERSRHTGFPTANLLLDECYVWPAMGVYAAWARVDGGRYRTAVNVGTRPTLGGGRGAALIEAHLLDFSGPLYGKTLDLSLVAFLRPERRFADLDALVAQVAADVSAVRELLGSVAS